MAKSESLKIVNGPSELDFFVLGLARGQEVFFDLLNSREICLKMSVKIVGIKAESGDYKNWLFEGYFTGPMHVSELFGIEVGTFFNGYYSYTQNRTGWLQFLKQV